MPFLGGSQSDSVKRNSANFQRIQPHVHFYLSWNNKKSWEINQLIHLITFIFLKTKQNPREINQHIHLFTFIFLETI